MSETESGSRSRRIPGNGTTAGLTLPGEAERRAGIIDSVARITAALDAIGQQRRSA